MLQSMYGEQLSAMFLRMKKRESRRTTQSLKGRACPSRPFLSQKQIGKNSSRSFSGGILSAVGGVIEENARVEAASIDLYVQNKQSRTNLCLYSQNIDIVDWSKINGAVITPNTAIAPDGTLTADAMTGPAGTA